MNALFEAKQSDHAQLVVCFDKEEIGSFGNTGAQGRFLFHAVERLLRAAGETVSEHAVMTALAESKALSADVAATVDPNWPEVNDLRNAAQAVADRAQEIHRQPGKSGASDASRNS